MDHWRTPLIRRHGLSSSWIKDQWNLHAPHVMLASRTEPAIPASRLPIGLPSPLWIVRMGARVHTEFPPQPPPALVSTRAHGHRPVVSISNVTLRKVRIRTMMLKMPMLR